MVVSCEAVLPLSTSEFTVVTKHLAVDNWITTVKLRSHRLALCQAVAIIPFALKPLVALLSDAFPIAGYHKLPYVVTRMFISVSFSKKGPVTLTCPHGSERCLKCVAALEDSNMVKPS